MMHLLTSTPSYLWKSPAEWLRADATHVNCVIQEIVTLTGSTEIEQAKFVREMIYYRLIVYIFAHLTLFTSVFTVEIFHRDGINRLFSNFKVTLEHWQSWDSMTIVENYLKTRHYLCNRFRLDLQSYLSCHDESVLGALLALGDTGLTSNTRKCSVGGSGTGSIESPSGTLELSGLSSAQVSPRECVGKAVKGVKMLSRMFGSPGSRDRRRCGSRGQLRRCLQGTFQRPRDHRQSLVYQKSNMDSLLEVT